MSEDWDFQVLKRQILKDRGFDCSQYRDNYIKRRLGIRMRANNVDSYKDYAVILKRDASEYDKLLEALTINVSEFFRDSSVFNEFEKNVIPQLISDKKRKNQKIIRIWSAGCASGEETYSIAMLLFDFLGTHLKDFIVFVRGTDIDDDALGKARKGEYNNLVPPNVPNSEMGYLSIFSVYPAYGVLIFCLTCVGICLPADAA